MSLMLKETSSFEKPEPGMYIARCYLAAQLGLQKSTWEDVITYKDKVRLCFELPNDLVQEGNYAGQPLSVHNDFNISFAPNSRLRQDLEAWRGKPFTAEELAGFDLMNIVGAPCMINIVHSKCGNFANIKSISPMLKGTECPAQVNQSVKFSLEDSTTEEFEALPEYLQKKINRDGSTEEIIPAAQGSGANTAEKYGAQGGEPQEFAEDDDDIPF